MADIKIKKKDIGTIKKLDRAKVYTQKLKNNIVDVKNKATYNSNEESPTEYGSNKLSEETNIIFRKSINNFNEYGKKSVKETAENIGKSKEKIKSIKKKIIDKKIKKKAEKIVKKTGKNTKRTIKTAKQTGKVTYKTAKNTTKVAIKSAKKAYQIAKVTTKATIKSIKLAIKVTIATIKAIIAATKALVSAIIAGGWVAIIIIIVICLIAMLVGSIFGIFFSSENTGSTITVNGTEQVVTMNKVISDLNIEFMNKLTQIQQENVYDEYEINSQKAEWKDVLAVYVAKVSNGDNTVEMMTLNDEKVNSLKEIFWAMNEITSITETRKKQVEVTDDKGNITIQEKDITVLKITVTGKNANQMADQYNFNQNQKNQLVELKKEEYAIMWSAVIYGSSVGSNDIVEVARQQIGNVGGQPYWSWYGFESRVEWCACFVSWCANECGYIESGIIPKFAGCEAEGVAWFRICGLWKERGYSPKARRYNLF